MINYKLLAQFQTYYERHGYQEIHMPWTVSEKASNMTLPQGRTIVKSDIGLLLGSAEQGFLDLVMNQGLKGKFQATTPCFRNELEDELHQTGFMKTELFNNQDTSDEELFRMVHTVLGIVNTFFNCKIETQPDGSVDIIDERNGIEIGSYGRRSNSEVGTWLYGTGLALPRFSIVGKKAGKEYV